MDAKHTPGPWTVEDRRGSALKNIRIVAGDHDIAWVSDVHQRDPLGTFDGNHAAADSVDAIGLANARLIAAAPLLLATLIEAVGPLELYHAYGWPDRDRVLNKIAAAIAAARPA